MSVILTARQILAQKLTPCQDGVPLHEGSHHLRRHLALRDGVEMVPLEGIHCGKIATVRHSCSGQVAQPRDFESLFSVVREGRKMPRGCSERPPSCDHASFAHTSSELKRDGMMGTRTRAPRGAPGTHHG